MRVIRYGMLICLSFTSTAKSDDARQVFDTVFGARMKQVQSTIDPADDVALAGKLLDSARSATDVELLSIMCESAYDLGSKHIDGYESAIAAMGLLAKMSEKARTVANEKQIQLLTRLSRLGKADERDAASLRLVDLLISVGDNNAQAGRYVDAATDFRRALAVANSSKALPPDAAKAKLEWAMQCDRAVKRAAILQVKLLANANDNVTAEELATIYILELNDVAAANALVSRVKDPTMKLVIEAKSNTTFQPSGVAAIDVGKWYQAAADKTKGHERAALLDTAIGFMVRAMESSDAGSVTFTTASLLATEAKKQLDLLKAELAQATKPRITVRRGELLAEDKHVGSTGYVSTANVYTLKLRSETLANRTILVFKGTSPASSNGSSNGDIAIRAAGADWVKVGGWTTESIKSATKKEDWQIIDLSALPDTVTSKEYEVKFQYSNGVHAFEIQHVKLVTR